MFVARRKMIRWNLRGKTLQNYEEVIIRRSNLCWDGRICENSSGSLDESITLDGLNTSRPFRVKDGERLVLRSSKSYSGNNEAKPKKNEKIFTTSDWRINKMIVQVRHWCSLLHLSMYPPLSTYLSAHEHVYSICDNMCMCTFLEIQYTHWKCYWINSSWTKSIICPDSISLISFEVSQLQEKYNQVSF